MRREGCVYGIHITKKCRKLFFYVLRHFGFGCNSLTMNVSSQFEVIDVLKNIPHDENSPYYSFPWQASSRVFLVLMLFFGFVQMFPR